MNQDDVVIFGRWAMVKIDKVCQKHGEQMYAVGPNQVEVCQACGKEEIEKYRIKCKIYQIKHKEV